MTVEELDMVINIQPILVEFKKIVPQLKKIIKQIQDNLNKIDTNTIIDKVKQTTKQLKQELKNGKDVSIQEQLHSQFKEAQSDIEEYQKELEKKKQELKQVYEQINKIQDDTLKTYNPTGEVVKKQETSMQAKNDLSGNQEYQETLEQAKTLEQQVIGLNNKLIATKLEYSQIALQMQQVIVKQTILDNFWNYNNNGAIVIENLAGSFDKLLTKINNVIQSPSFQMWLQRCSDRLKGISERIASINWGPLVDSLTKVGTFLGESALDALTILVEAFKWLIENPVVAEIIIGIAIAIGVVCTAVGTLSSVMTALTAISTGLTASLSSVILPIIGIIIAVGAIIAICILLANNWEWIKQKTLEVWWIIINTINNVTEGVRSTIVNVLNTINTVWTNIWNGMRNVVISIWNGIWAVIRGVINSILAGIEGMVNGAIRGINFILKGISKVASAVGSVIGLGPINLQLSTISLPRLAKGGVLTRPTTILAGEYSNARSNPEIVTPQNIMAETFDSILSKYNRKGTETINFVNELKVNGKTIAREIIQDLNEEAKRMGYKPLLQRG